MAKKVKIYTYDDPRLNGVVYTCYDEGFEDVAGLSDGLSGDCHDHSMVAKLVAEKHCGLQWPLSCFSRIEDTADDTRIVWVHEIKEAKACPA